MRHIPVLLSDVLMILKPKAGETVLDVTVGLGGHARSFLESIGPSGKLIGLDADTENLEEARSNLSQFQNQLDLRHGNFGMLTAQDLPPVDILFADLGLSSPHVDESVRGFSFRSDGPLDLRYDRSRGRTARELIASMDESRLSSILKRYGEIRSHRSIAQALKKVHPERTLDIAKCLEEVCGFRAPSVLPQVFQALRIAVNDELGVLGQLLALGPSLLKGGGRMGVISYHSLEDRMVKNAFRVLTLAEKDSITGQLKSFPPFELLTKKAVSPLNDEVTRNPRSRSAKFRAIRKMAALRS